MSRSYGWRSNAPALLAFGSDSVVELLSASVVLLQFLPRFTLSEAHAAWAAAVLLFALAAIIALIAILLLIGNMHPLVLRFDNEKGPVQFCAVVLTLEREQRQTH